MKKMRWIVICLPLVFASCFDPSGDRGLLPKVPEGAQAVSLMGEPLYGTPPTIGVIARFRAAEKAYKADSKNADNLIWYGRRTAYTGDYRGAIRIFRNGIREFPKDARFYRHRGHRYLSIREFNRAIRDLKKAAKLIEGRKDRIEPDGMPNPQNTPIGTLHGNIWYHLGLAYYLTDDLDNALMSFQSGLAAAGNDDKLVSTTCWIYLILQRLGRETEAEAALEPVRPKMNIIENFVYHRLCLFYKGLIPLEELHGEGTPAVQNDAIAYGIGAWHLFNGHREQARKMFESIVAGGTWDSFGHIAAEADLVREFPDLR